METFTEDDDDDLDENNEELMEDGTLKPKKRKKRKNALYEMRIRAMCAANASSLEISYLHLMSREPTLAIWIVDAPRDLLDVLRETATRHTLRLFPGLASIHDEVHVRIADIPILDSLRDLRRSHLDCLVSLNINSQGNGTAEHFVVQGWYCDEFASALCSDCSSESYWRSI
mmetsp:Transcript_36217/g.53037  ORF Transcript_36217/g.53037 Transcript_36217/m.53037 type:complete len:172 (-) Transcript_36217:109-624(-)